MATKISEVVYRLKDLFTGPVTKVAGGYRRIRDESRKSAASVERDNSRISKGFAGLTGGINSLIGSWRGLAAAVTGGAVANSFRNLVNEADRVGKAASKIGLTTEALSKLAFAASKENIDFGAIEIGLQRMTRRIGEAAGGSESLRKVFNDLGLDVEELNRLAPDQAFLKIADATRAVSSEKEQLALFFKIFDTEGVNLIRLARQGSDAINQMGTEAERLGQVFGAEFTQNAAQFNDRLTELQARLTGLKIDAFSRPLKELVEFIDNIGAGDQITGLTTELLLLERRLAKPFLFDFGGAGKRDVERRIDAIRTKLILLTREREKAGAVSNAESAGALERKRINDENAKTLDELTEKYKAAAAAKKTALATETAELRAARSEQQSIEAEFAQLREDVTGKAPEEVTGQDVQLKLLEARTKLREGDADAAIKAARQSGDLLRQLEGQGEEAGFVLSFLAKQIEGVANAAAQSKVDAEVIDVDKAKAAFDAITEQAKILASTAGQAGGEYARAFLEAMKAEFAAATIPAPTVAPPTTGANRIRRSGNNFSDGTNYQPPTSLERELEKRGDK